ncbi:Uncharacterised protein [Vibrio cholerae]|nr:Uncharacterised protein [Vibrio cholerae]
MFSYACLSLLFHCVTSVSFCSVKLQAKLPN